jgi:hypothetical protein
MVPEDIFYYICRILLVKWMPWHCGMVHFWVANRGESLHVWRVAANILNNLSQTVGKGWFSSLGLDGALTTPHLRRLACYEILHKASDLVGRCEHSNELLET